MITFCSFLFRNSINVILLFWSCLETEKISGKLIHITLTLVLTVYKVIIGINQLKGIYFAKVREILELVSCQTSDAIPAMCVPKRSLVFSFNL